MDICQERLGGHLKWDEMDICSGVSRDRVDMSNGVSHAGVLELYRASNKDCIKT